MLSKGKLSLLGFLAIFALSLAVSSTAAAVEPLPHFISEKKELKVEFPGKGKLGEFYIEVPGFEFIVLCAAVDNKVEIGPSGKSKLTIEFKNCKVYNLKLEPLPCTVSEPIIIKLRDQLVYKNHKEGEEILEIFYPDEGAGVSKFSAGVFTKITIKACVLFEGKYEVKGSAIAFPSPNTPGKEAKLIKLNFNGKEAPTGTYYNQETKKEEEAGKMKLAGKEAFLKGTIEQELENKAEYGAE
jgi:hypothetical protein